MVGKPSVGIIGDGNVGKAIAQGLKRAGYKVQTVGRDLPAVREIAKSAELIILAVPHGERRNALNEMGDAWKGKTLVDVSNNLTPKGYGGSLDKSGAEELQAWAKDAKVVKAFNTIFAQHMNTGQIDGERLSLFIAGDDKTAKQKVMTLAQDIGFEPVDAGPLSNARWLEAFGYLNVNLAYAQGMGPNMGFRLVRAGASKARTVEASAATAD